MCCSGDGLLLYSKLRMDTSGSLGIPVLTIMTLLFTIAASDAAVLERNQYDTIWANPPYNTCLHARCAKAA